MHFTLTDLIIDISQNGIESGADLLELSVSETTDTQGKNIFRFTVKDNGRGMSYDELILAKDPFVTNGIKHPNRKVGLGIPFLIQTAESSGGGWNMDSKKGEGAPETGSSVHGTEISAWFDLDNVDTPPVGDIPGLFRTVLLFDGPGEILIRRQCNREAGDPENSHNYEIRKSELSEVLGGLEDAQSLILLDQYLRSLEESGDEQ